MKDVIGYENLFSITEDGKLWSKRTKRFLKQTISKTGYYTVSTKIGGRNGTSKCFKIHRLVCEAYHENPDDKPFVNHKDGNKLNNKSSNLEWCTPSENIQHAFDTGLNRGRKGVDSSSSKLTIDQVLYIKKNYKPRCKINGARALANKFGVVHSVIVHTYQGDRY